MYIYCHFRISVAFLVARSTRHEIVKSGTACLLLLDVDDTTFSCHFLLRQEQLDVLLRTLLDMEDESLQLGCPARLSVEKKLLLFLWYSFRELSDKFNLT